MLLFLAKTYYNELLDAGVKIYEYTPGLRSCQGLHLRRRKKRWWVRSIWITGAFYHHFENGCFMADCDAVLDIRRGYGADIGTV